MTTYFGENMKQLNIWSSRLSYVFPATILTLQIFVLDFLC